MRAILAILFCLYTYHRESAAQFSMSTAQKQAVLDLHNELRGREGASDMLLMVRFHTMH